VLLPASDAPELLATPVGRSASTPTSAISVPPTGSASRTFLASRV
ncbi:MAG: hypothetical protein AVDCRST_MAG41-2847, partial [uncultured Corynebacteriales bacterium]